MGNNISMSYLRVW